MGDAGKRAAGEAAAALIEDGMRLGLGTGSTVAYFLDALGVRGLSVSGVPTSEWTAQRCRELGIAVLEPGEVTRLDLAVDGADELTPDLTLTKGGGGAHLREKVVASVADRFVVIATPDKVVQRLGDTFAFPVEVVPFAVASVTRDLEALGLEVRVRGGAPAGYRTDNGNAVLDCRVDGGLDDPEVTDLTIAMLTGVAATGLFIDLATDAILGHPDGGVTRLPG